MTFLFVDDELRSIQRLMDQLELEDYIVKSVRTVEEALHELEAAPFECLVLDIMMATTMFSREETENGLRTGQRFFELVRERWPTQPVIILTNVDDRGLEEYFERAPRCVLLLKEDILPREVVAVFTSFLRECGVIAKE